MSSRRRLVLVFAGLAALVLVAPAGAAWNGGGNAGDARSKARSLGAVTAPSLSANGRSVAISWTAPAGAPPGGYIVKRYDGSGQSQSVGAACSGTVSGTSCTENGVSPGSWTYKVTAVRGANWRGAEGAGSSVTVDSPSLTLAPATVTSFPTVLSGGVTGFVAGQTVSFRLDDPSSGPILSGSTTPATIPTGGQATVSVTIPAGTSNGEHTVFAVGSGADLAQAPIIVNRPQVTASVTAKSAGGRAGKIRQGGTYRVYANVTGSGNPPAGLASLTADVNAITTGQTAAALTNGSYYAGGQSYNYRSAQLTANVSLSAGSKPYTVKLTDAGGTVTTSSYSVIVDNTKPTAVDVQATNAFGGTIGRAEPGDVLTLTYSEDIEPISILAGWNGSSTNVVVRLNNGALADTVQVWNAANSAQLPYGTVDLKALDYTLANRTFGLTGTPSTMVMSSNAVTITLGTASGATTTALLPSAMTWTPSATATDEAGNAAATTAVTESGASDKNF
ncbi:MAG TPA: fibronectin type III domain-containing protein [Solirubrobacterales bacterium]|nr:fibronectin type III domain-containing protein [Solirubrobacterales bacterium]